jgi:RNA polymerase sigma-70 factor (ECF subfamily)
VNAVEVVGKRDDVDCALLAAMRAGDNAAFDRIFTRHYRAVFSAAFGLTKNVPDAEDVAQEAFVVFWQKRHGIVLAGDSALPWLLTTTRYVGLNTARSKVRRGVTGVEGDLIAAAVPAVEETVQAAMFAAYLDQVVASLPELDRSIYQMCLVDGRSYEDAARELGVSKASLRGRLARLRQRLQGEIIFMRGKS